MTADPAPRCDDPARARRAALAAVPPTRALSCVAPGQYLIQGGDHERRDHRPEPAGRPDHCRGGGGAAGAGGGGSAAGVCGLRGPNGAGKTSLLRMMATAIPPTSGRLRLLGRDPRSYSPRREIRRRLGYLPQNLGYYPRFTVAEFVEYFALLKEM